jgi:hypothetical protein
MNNYVCHKSPVKKKKSVRSGAMVLVILLYAGEALPYEFQAAA